MSKLKKILSIIMIMIISIFLLTITSKAASKVKVTADTINVRKGPSTSTSVIAMLSKGVECEIIEEEEEWYKIKYKTYTGYVSKEYVEIIEETTSIDNDNTINNNSDKTDENNDTTNNNVTNTVDTNNENSNQNIDNVTNEDTILENSNASDSVQITYKKIKQNEKLKLLPLIYSNDIEALKKDAKVILLTENNLWSYIQTDVSCGWVRTEFLEDVNNTDNENFAERTVYINESSVNMRKGAGTSYNILKVLSLNTQVTITGEEGTWYKIKVDNTVGYVSKDYISDTKTTTTRSSSNSRIETMLTTTGIAETKTEKVVEDNVSEQTQIDNEKTTTAVDKVVETVESSNKNTTTKIKGTDIVAYAKKYLGYKYVYGGDGSNGTFDCSGFTMYVYKHFGIIIPHGANAQYNCGKGTKIIKYSDLQIGDIVMLTDYETGVGIGHCGIYIGNDNFIHASTTCNAVEISSFNTIYSGRFYAGLRLI